ncbi:MAG: hypothetical protein ABIE70_11675 [bacterium]
MKVLLMFGLILVFGLSLAVIGCGQKEATPDKPPLEVQEAESMDSTAMDSAAMEDVPVDSMVQPHDSM